MSTSILANVNEKSIDERRKAYMYMEGSTISLGTVYDYQLNSTATSNRGNVNGFSRKSKARLSRYISAAKSKYRYLGTLTVGNEWDRDGEAFKHAVDKFFQWFMRQQRERCSNVSRGTQSICWFLEFQKRGAPHIHFFYTTPVPWQLAAAKWREALELHAVCDDPNIERAGTKFEKLRRGRLGAASYARKYAIKQDQKLVPEGYRNAGRFWGIRGFREIVSCQMAPVESERGFEAQERVKNVMEKAVKMGIYRKFKWKEGSGATYFPEKGVKRSQILWVISYIYAEGAGLLDFGNAEYYLELSSILSD